MPAFTYPTSWTDICNQALARLGVTLISSVTTDTTQAAVYCRMFLGDAIDAVLAAAEWRAFSARVELAQLSETPAYGFDYAYQMPTDCVRLISLDNGGEEFSVEGDRLLTDAEQVFITYVQRPSDPTKVAAPVRRAIQGQLAALLALPLTSSEQTASRALTLAAMDLQEAVKTEGDRKYVEDTLGFTWNDELRGW